MMLAPKSTESSKVKSTNPSEGRSKQIQPQVHCHTATPEYAEGSRNIGVLPAA
jgi:hypothetical protein